MPARAHLALILGAATVLLAAILTVLIVRATRAAPPCLPPAAPPTTPGYLIFVNTAR